MILYVQVLRTLLKKILLALPGVPIKAEFITRYKIWLAFFSGKLFHIRLMHEILRAFMSFMLESMTMFKLLQTTYQRHRTACASVQSDQHNC